MELATVPGQRRLSNLDPLTDKQLRDAERDKVYIFNVAPREHRVVVGKMWTIPACPDGESVSAALVVPGTVFTSRQKSVHGLHVDYEWISEDGIDVARDIIGTAPFKDRSENLTRMGVFLSMSPVPLEEEVDAATSEWLDRCNEKLNEGDAAYAINAGRVDLGNGRSASNIGKDHIEAARILGVDRPWSTKNAKLELCDECGTGNLATAAFCKQCDNMLNAEAAQRKFPAKYAERTGVVAAEVRRGPGRPRNEV
jgi:hypothetical protein